MEPKVQIVLAEQLQQQQSGQGQLRNVLVNPIIGLRVPFIPGAVTFTISVMTYGISFEKQNTFKLKIFKLDDETSVPYEIETQTIEPNLGMKADNFNFNFELANTPFYQEGEYIVEFTLNDKEHREEFVIKADQILGMNGQ